MEIKFEQDYNWSKKAAYELCGSSAKLYIIAFIWVAMFSFIMGLFCIAARSFVLPLVILLCVLFAVAAVIAIIILRIKRIWGRVMLQDFDQTKAPLPKALVLESKYIELRNLQTCTFRRRWLDEIAHIYRTRSALVVYFVTKDSIILPRTAEIESAMDNWRRQVNV